MTHEHIVKIEWAKLVGQRPRLAGCNARLGEHGIAVWPSLARVTTSGGATGFGWAALTEAQARPLLGVAVETAFDANQIVAVPYRCLEYPLYDLAGQLAGQPVYALLGGQPEATGVYRVPCYDTSLYIDDLRIAADDEAAAFIAGEALEGTTRGHRAFKLKVGRGALHMPLEAGTRRDIRVIRAVREAVGPEAQLMLDANNGYNVNLVKRVLSETADANVYWIEEAFHEDVRLYEHLKAWLAAQGLRTLIADGEGDASPHLLAWAQQGVVDVVQYDVLRPGFARWLELGPQLDAWGVRSAPHHYGEPYGNYAACHLRPAIQRFERIEWDDAAVPGLDASTYRIVEGEVLVPALPGFGLRLDDALYTRAVWENGFVVQ